MSAQTIISSATIGFFLSMSLPSQTIWEEFDPNGSSFDLEGVQLTLFPAGDQYVVMQNEASHLPVDISVGDSLALSSENDAVEKIVINNGKKFPFFGKMEDSVFVDSNGRVGFEVFDADSSQTVAELFEMRQIAVLWDDLAPGQSGSILASQDDQRLTITWDNVTEIDAANQSNCQLELFFDGRIRMTFLDVDSENPLVGISPGDLEFDSNRDRAVDLGSVNFIPVDLITKRRDYIKASNTGQSDRFGYASVVSGDTMVVSAPFEDSGAIGINGEQDDDSSTDSGAVYVFVRAGENWVQQAYLKASNAGTGDQFGTSLALSGDTLVVGATLEDGGGRGIGSEVDGDSAENSGAVYIFTRTEDSWEESHYLKSSNSDAGDGFGRSVEIFDDTIAVAAAWEESNASEVNGDESDNSQPRSGAVYVFRQEGESWKQEAYLKASNNEGDGFGASLSLYENKIAVGATSEDSNATGVNGDQADNSASGAGAVYVFERTGEAWSQEAFLKASNTEAGDRFGSALSLFGNTLAVSAPQEAGGSSGVGGDQNDNSQARSGAVYIFRFENDQWDHETYLKPSLPTPNTYFGANLKLERDLLFVGEFGVHVFVDNQGEWAEKIHLVHENDIPDKYDAFGSSIDFDGDHLIIGALSEDSSSTGINDLPDNDLSDDSGAVFTFQATAFESPAIFTVKNSDGAFLNSGRDEIKFEPAILNQTGRSVELTISNTGLINITNPQLFLSENISQDFLLTARGLESDLLPGESTQITIQLNPRTAGILRGELDISSSTFGSFPFTLDLDGYGLTPESAALEAYLKSPSNIAGGDFGTVMAISGNTLAVGVFQQSSRDEFDSLIRGAGVVYVYVREGGSWREEATISPTFPGRNDSFGASLALSGNTLVIGAPGEDSDAQGIDGDPDNNSLESSGAVFVYTRADGFWTEEAYLKSSNSGWLDQFGGSVAISGNMIAVGANGEDSNASGVDGDQDNDLARDSGAVYIFENFQGSWRQSSYLKPAHPDGRDRFGSALSFSGNTLAVGAPEDDGRADGNGSDNEAFESGAVFVFEKTPTGWQQQAFLKPTNSKPNNFFGQRLSLSGDLLVVGFPNDGSAATGVDGNQDDTSSPNSGAAIVFERKGNTWNQQAYLKASNTDEGDWFGNSVAISGTNIVVGAPRESSASLGINGEQEDNSSPHSGAAYMFKLLPSGWVQTAYFKAPNAEGTLIFGEPLGDQFGRSLVLSKDLLVIAAPFEDSNAKGVNGDSSDNSIPDAGATYIYQLSKFIDGKALFEQAALEAGLTGDDLSPSATPFADGVSNLLKYAFNMDLSGRDRSPLKPDSINGLPFPRRIEAQGVKYFAFEYLRRKESGLNYTPMTSTSLNPDSFKQITGEFQITKIDSQWERVTVLLADDPERNGKQFFKVRVSF